MQLKEGLIWLGDFEMLISLATFIVVSILGIKNLWWDRRQSRQRYKDIKSNPGSRPAILVVDLNPSQDITNQVRNYVQQSQALKDIPEERFFTVQRQKNIDAEEVPEIIGEIRAKKSTLAHYGPEVIHLFYAGPSALAHCLGGELFNGCRVMVYQYNQGQYENWGPLKHNVM